jgi:hypothetical protein
MDQVSIGEIRLLSRELGALSVWDRERRDELLQALEFILQQEEAGQRGVDPALLVACSLETQVTFLKSGSCAVVMPTQYPVFIAGGLYVEGELISLCRSWGSGPFGISGGLRVGPEPFNNPLEIRGKAIPPGIPVAFDLWANLMNPRLALHEGILRVTLLGISLKESPSRAIPSLLDIT